MDDDTDQEGFEFDEPEDDSGFAPASAAGSKRVRIIGAEQASSVIPPEGFAVTEDPLEAELDLEPLAEDPLEALEDERPLDLRWSPTAPAGEQSADLPHWTAPPTGQVPAVLARDEPDLPEWQRAGDTGPVWREHEHDWADPGFEPALLADEGTRVGELRTEELAEERRPWDFDDAVEASEESWAREEEVRLDDEGVEPEAVPAGQVRTISSSVRSVTSGQVQAPPARSRPGRRRSFSQETPDPLTAP